MYKILLLFCLLLCYACSQTENMQENVKIRHINYSDASKKELSAIPDSILKNPHYILVKEKSKDFLCQQFSKVKCYANKYYILDITLKKLIVCDSNGNLINKIGVRGNGPEEYLSIIDFDIDSKGFIYCIDGQLDKLFIYNPNYTIKDVLKLPFEADAIQMMDNGDILFGLSSWNTQKGEGFKIMLTDNKLKTKHVFLPYDEYKDDNYWISTYSFTKHGKAIAYNQPIDNNVYMIPSENMDSIQSYLFDFGSRNVVNEYKKNIERNLKEFEHYTLLKSPVVATPDYIAGTLLDGRKTKFFIFDIKNNISYEGEETEEYDNSQLVGYSEPYIISVIEPMIELPKGCTYPDSVKNHLLHEGRVITLRQLHTN